MMLYLKCMDFLKVLYFFNSDRHHVLYLNIVILIATCIETITTFYPQQIPSGPETGRSGATEMFITTRMTDLNVASPEVFRESLVIG